MRRPFRFGRYSVLSGLLCLAEPLYQGTSALPHAHNSLCPNPSADALLS
jgi:hypothetical protein